MKTLLLPALILSSFASGQSIERSLIGSSGASFSVGSLHLDHSIGETVISEANNGNVTVYNGYQQAYDIITSVQNAFYHEVLLFPNPFSEQIVISDNEIFTQIVIYNMQGQIVHNADLTKAKHINLSHLSAGVYQVKLFTKDQTIFKTTQIQKI